MATDPRTPKRIVNLVTLAVPGGIIIASLLPLRPLVQQGLVGITLLWFYLEFTLVFGKR